MRTFIVLVCMTINGTFYCTVPLFFLVRSTNQFRAVHQNVWISCLSLKIHLAMTHSPSFSSSRIIWGLRAEFNSLEHKTLTRKKSLNWWSSVAMGKRERRGIAVFAWDYEERRSFIVEEKDLCDYDSLIIFVIFIQMGGKCKTYNEEQSMICSRNVRTSCTAG